MHSTAARCCAQHEVRERGSEVVGGLCVQGVVGRISADNSELVEFLRCGARELRGLM